MKVTPSQNYSIVVLIIVFAVVLLRTAWVTDDAYITFRTVDNFINGFGLTWNVLDRVQTYTNPLWMFVISLFYWFTTEIYYTSIFLSIAISIVALCLLSFKIALKQHMAVLVIGILLLSKAYIDYSTSGLENPLTHLILVLFFLQYFKIHTHLEHEKEQSALLLITITVSFALINRMDTALIYLMPLGYTIFNRQIIKRRIGIVALGFIPFIMWEIFSLLYYGFPFPNTAYAKLSHGIDQHKMIFQGVYYLLNSIDWDPLTLTVILSVSIHSFWSFKKNKALFFISASVLLHLCYLIIVGGGHMSGRLLTPALLCSVIVLARHDLDPIKQFIPAFAAIVLLGFISPTPTLLSDGSFNRDLKDRNGIRELRGTVYQGTGLLRTNRIYPFSKSPWAKKGTKEKAKGKHRAKKRMIGFFGFYAGPDVHIIDPLGLGDPLLARLPIPNTKKWRISHYQRLMPEGYFESTSEENKIVDSSLALYFDKLTLVTRGPLFSFIRFKEIVRFNTGMNDYLIDAYLKNNPFENQKAK